MKREHGIWYLRFAGRWWAFASLSDAIESLHVEGEK
jgi:hypothetical protein